MAQEETVSSSRLIIDLAYNQRVVVVAFGQVDFAQAHNAGSLPALDDLLDQGV
jgi:hypothetical protein